VGHAVLGQQPAAAAAHVSGGALAARALAARGAGARRAGGRKPVSRRAARGAGRRGALPAGIGAAYAEVALDLSARGKRWLGGLFVSTWVDGRRWERRRHNCDEVLPDRGPSGKLRAQLYAACDRQRLERRMLTMFSDPGLTLAATHRVQMRLWLPGTAAVVRSAEIPVALRCAPQRPSSR